MEEIDFVKDLKFKYKKEGNTLKEKINYLLFTSPKVWELQRDIQHTLTNGETIILRKGFETDLRSVPPFLEILLSRKPKTLLAYLVHDWLYKTDYKRLEWGDKLAKEFADKEMLFIAKSIAKRFDNKLSYLAVKWFGKKVFKRWND